MGSLFTQKAFVDDEEKKEDSDNEDDDHLSPEDLRREIYEQVLKKRIFYSDRIEKIEKVLLSHNLIAKDSNFCDAQQLAHFMSNL